VDDEEEEQPNEEEELPENLPPLDIHNNPYDNELENTPNDPSLHEMLESLGMSNETEKVFSLYTLFVYFRFTQAQFSAMINLFNSPIWKMGIKFNVQKVYSNIQDKLEEAEVYFLTFTIFLNKTSFYLTLILKCIK